MTCSQCPRPDSEHTERVDDAGRVVRYCPPASPETPADRAKARIAEIRSALKETK